MHALVHFVSRALLTLALTCTFNKPAHAERTLVHEAVIPAPPADVWNAFATSEGLRSWMSPHADIDLRIGGEMRTNYQPEGVIGDKSTIVNQVLAFEPQRMLTIRNTRAPEGFPHADLFQQTWTVIHFDPIEGQPDRTHVRIAGLGWGEGADWDVIYNFFKAGNAQVLDELRAHFQSKDQTADNKADDPQRVMELLGRMVGGEWIHEGKPPAPPGGAAPEGAVFRVRNVVEFGPDGASTLSRGWLGDASGMFMHSACLTWLEPASADGSPRQVRFVNVDQGGAIARGAVRLVDRESLQWEWNSTAPDGKTSQFRVTETFKDNDHYHLQIERQDEHGAWSDMVNADFARVDNAPAEFLKMRGE